MSDRGTVTITKDEYVDLLNDSAKLRALRSGGVNNWEWYDEAMENYEEIGMEDLDLPLDK